MTTFTTSEKTHTGFSRDALQLIAMITMVIDHFETIFVPFNQLYFRYHVNLAIVGRLGSFLNGIGRIAFPIFLFLIADGCRRTRNIKKYAFRLGIFAIISEFCYAYAFAFDAWHSPLNNFSDFLVRFHIEGKHCVMWTLLACVLFIWATQHLYEKSKQNGKQKWYPVKFVLLLIAVMLVQMPFGAEYWEISVPLAAFLYYVPNRKKQLYAMGIFFIILYVFIPAFQPLLWGQPLKDVLMNFHHSIQIFEIIGVAVSLFLISKYHYAPENAPRHSRLIYWFYPVHLLILGLIRDSYLIITQHFKI